MHGDNRNERKILVWEMKEFQLGNLVLDVQMTCIINKIRDWNKNQSFGQSFAVWIDGVRKFITLKIFSPEIFVGLLRMYFYCDIKQLSLLT